MNRFRYLNGIDWVVTGLDHSLRQTAGTGNWAQLVVEVDGTVDFERFCAAARRFCGLFPVLQGRAVRGWQLVPVWKMPRRLKPSAVPVNKHFFPQSAAFETIVECLGQCIAVPPGTPGRYLGFNLLYHGKKTWLAFRFDHRLLDARGAELFLHRLIQSLNGAGPDPDADVAGQKACLTPWAPKFKSGRQVVRMLHRTRHEAAPFDLSPRSGPEARLRFTILPLTPQQSAGLLDRAYAEAGYLMLTPWLASLITAALEQANPQCIQNLNGFMVPCSADLRTDPQRQMFFNYAAFVCLSRPAGEPPPEGWALRFSRQFADQLKSGLPRDFENAWKLSRIIPAALYGRLLRGPLGVFGGTLSLANVGDGLSAIRSVDGLAVGNAFHMPAVPPAPGMGFFVNSCNGCLNLCLVSSSRVLSGEEHARLTDHLKARLFNPARE